ncbi:hypothetical protein HMPREF1495_1456 [Lachnoanaerobaculum sp. MSX33]|nr:hypothetical protein HMPREF1495_1456 [Lachnoanaerobaculum sp. MSX33]
MSDFGQTFLFVLMSSVVGLIFEGTEKNSPELTNGSLGLFYIKINY